MLLQGLLALVLVLACFRLRPQLAGSERWQFVAQRPIAAGLFASLMVGFPFYTGPPVAFVFAFTLVAGIALARLLGGLLDTGWRTQPVYGLLTLLILIRLFYTLDLSTPLLRLYILVAALLSLVWCLRWSTQTARGGDAPWAAGGFGVAAVFFTLVVCTEVWGEAERAEYLFTSSLRTLLNLLAFGLLLYLIRGGLIVHAILPAISVGYEVVTVITTRRAQQQIFWLTLLLLISQVCHRNPHGLSSN